MALAGSRQGEADQLYLSSSVRRPLATSKLAVTSVVLAVCSEHRSKTTEDPDTAWRPGGVHRPNLRSSVYHFTHDSSEFRPPLMARSATLRRRVPQTRTYATGTLKAWTSLTALLLAYNLFGDSFFEASCRLGGKSAGRCL
jgi:hypothetical protein